MEKTIMTLSDTKITTLDVLKHMHIEDSDGIYSDIIDELLLPSLSIAKPKAIYKICSVTNTVGINISGIAIESDLVARNLQNTNRVFAYVATCGTEIENWSKSLTDELEKYVADAIKLVLLTKMRKELFSEVRRLYFQSTNMSTMNPGSLKEWPISEQVKLFKIIGSVTEDIGVFLTDSFLMLPAKSVSGIFFSSEEGYKNCQYCPMENCPNRSAKKL